MTDITALERQRDEINRQIAELKNAKKKEALATVCGLVFEFGLTEAEIFKPQLAKPKAKASLGTKVAPKYRNAATGAEWTGRGKAPKWIADKDRAQFLIAA